MLQSMLFENLQCVFLPKTEFLNTSNTALRWFNELCSIFMRLFMWCVHTTTSYTPLKKLTKLM